MRQPAPPTTSPTVDQLEDVWSITMTDDSTYPHVTQAIGRDNAIAAFMSQAYMFVHAHKGTYSVVGEDNDAGLTGLHLIFQPENVDDVTICAVSLASPMWIESQDGYKAPAWGDLELVGIAAHLQSAIDNTKPSQTERNRLKVCEAALNWPRRLAEELLDGRTSGFEVSPAEGRRIWKEMGQVRQWTCGTARVICQ